MLMNTASRANWLKELTKSTRNMARFFTISLFSLLLIGSLASADDNAPAKKEEGYAIKIFNKLRKLPGIYGEIFGVWEMFQNIRGWFRPSNERPTNEEQLVILNQKIDELASDLKAFENRVSIKLEHLDYANQLRDAFNDFFNVHVEYIDDKYSKFLTYTNDSLHFSENKMQELVRSINSDGGVEYRLNGMHKAFGSAGEKLKESIPMLLGVASVGQEYMCKIRQSSQQSIQFLYETMLFTEIKGYGLIVYASEYENGLENVTETSDKEEAIRSFKTRMTKSFETVKEAMSEASREIWRCDVSNAKEGTHYARVGPVLQKDILYERRVTSRSGQRLAVCALSCPEIVIGKEECSSDYCDPHRCQGTVHKCEYVGDKVKLCRANSTDYRKYEYIHFENKKSFGNSEDCLTGDIAIREKDERYIFPILFLDCDYCLCTCETHNAFIDRYISLRPVYSDYDDNKVITGARIRPVKNIFHIEIRQGVLLPNGRIKSSDWKAVDVFIAGRLKDSILKDKDFYEISWDDREVFLDDLDSSSSDYKQDHVLTGLQFQKVKNQIELAVYLSRFNYTTGLLDKNDKPKLFTSDSRKRKELDLKELDVPINHYNNVKRSQKKEFIKFTTSSLEKDAGQNVVPFIDMQLIETNPPRPLSGAGLFLRADDKKESGGYLALKFFTLDTSPYLKDPKLGQE